MKNGEKLILIATLGVIGYMVLSAYNQPAAPAPKCRGLKRKQWRTMGDKWARNGLTAEYGSVGLQQGVQPIVITGILGQ